MSDPDFVREPSCGRESPPELDCEDLHSDSDVDVAMMNSSSLEVNQLSSFQNAIEKKLEDQNSEEGGMSDNGSSLSCDYIKRTELSLGDDTNNRHTYEETNFSRNGFARERTEASREDDGHNELQNALGQSINKNVTNNEGGSQVLEEDNGDDFDEDYLEKDDEKGDEDDDDLTKKLLSIQVLPRIPKIKRTQASGNNTSSESSAPQRSVLERAEVTTKSSSYPKWPKSSGVQADEKPRWRPDKVKEASRAPRIQRPAESSGSSDRFNGHAFNRSSGSNFKQTVGLEKSRTVFAKRVPCEMLFDAVMAKENPHAAPSVDKNTNEAEQPVTDVVSCSSSSSSPALQMLDALPSGVDFKGTERKRHSDEKSSSCGEKLAKKFVEGDFTDTNQRTSTSQNMGSRSQRGRQLESHRPKEGNGQKPEALSLNSQNSLSKVTQCKLPDFQPPEKSFCSSAKSSYNSDKQTSHGGISTVLQNAKSGETLTSSDNGGLAVETSPLVSDGVMVPPRLASFLPPSANSILTTSEDARFKRPSIQIVPRSRNLRRDSSLVNTKNLFPPSTDHSVMWKQSDKQSDVKSTPAETSKHPPEVEEEVPIPWGPEDGVMVEQQKPKKARIKPSLSAPLISSPQPVLDSSVEVVDMDVSASPLCDDNLLMSTDPVAGNSSITQATTRKMVTFDCPEDTGISHKDSSKKLKTSKHDQEVQRTLVCFLNSYNFCLSFQVILLNIVLQK